MGIHDRDYYQEDGPSGFTITGGPRLIVTNLVIVTVAIALIDIFTPVTRDQRGHWLSDVLALQGRPVLATLGDLESAVVRFRTYPARFGRHLARGAEHVHALDVRARD